MAVNKEGAQLIPGVSRLSRSQRYAKRGLFLMKNKVAVPRKASDRKAAARDEKPTDVNVDLVKALTHKKSSLYPADTLRKPKVNHKSNRPAALKETISPGSVLILLAGRFRGKRVVFLKQLESGLLLVTGPYRVNGVPMRRVNQAYVIATSAKVDVSDVTIPENINDSYFSREQEPKLKGTEEEFFGENAVKKAVPSHKAADQKTIDNQIIPKIRSQNMLASYLRSSFSLSKGQAPHLMKF
ncbi:60S ribosomal protein L6 [Smittium mucronatum]|uniref:60S ribosomal protein L6 n=1 Tax=Smittium mucronatum TaxID=133383 RepID=A0A1R0GW24_9FUNG|nr:60S ribosomal protein L6 [Smittium mucronatum]